jgi:hypothetical protein
MPLPECDGRMASTNCAENWPGPVHAASTVAGLTPKPGRRLGLRPRPSSRQSLRRPGPAAARPDQPNRFLTWSTARGRPA